MARWSLKSKMYAWLHHHRDEANPSFVRRVWSALSIVLLALKLCACGANATSAQIESAEPVFATDTSTCPTGASASFATVLGSRLYDTAGSLGGTFKGKMVGAGQLYFFADIFTWVDNVNVTEFRPRKIIYTIEPGYIIRRDKKSCRIFVKHQSFHDVDVSDEITESYELYGVSLARYGDIDQRFSIGKYLNERIVDYDWDLAASATVQLGSARKQPIYGHVWLHHVTEHGNIIGRDGFTDYAVEIGIKWFSGMTGFLRCEFLHDMDAFGGISDHYVLVGARYAR